VRGLVSILEVENLGLMAGLAFGLGDLDLGFEG